MSTIDSWYPYIKSLHVIFMVTWFAALFYIVRLFVYHTEAQNKSEPDKSILIAQYKIMEDRLWNIIGNPGMVLTIITGVLLIYIAPYWLQQPWMHIKLAFVFLLLSYHFTCTYFIKQFRKNESKRTSTFFRIWNELATLFLFAIVFLVILKSTVDWIFGILGLVVLGLLLMIGVRVYKLIRLKKGEE